jgi:hypothetical protein
MRTLTTLILAARIFLSLGIGTAMAQGLIPSSGETGYFSTQHQAAAKTTNLGVGPIESGQIQSGWPHANGGR